MKKQLISLVILVSLSTTVFAESFDIGGKEIAIQPPDGYVRVMEEMDAVYRLSQHMADPMNDLLAYYISQSDASDAIKGGLPPLERTFMIKVNKKTKGAIVGTRDFAQLISITKKQNKEIFESIKSEVSGFIDEMSEGISKEFDVDIAMQASELIPLDPHYESENAFAYSMYINFGVTSDQGQEKKAIAATATIVNVAGKVLFLYCYAPKEQVEWTREASKAWAQTVMAGNALPPANTSGSGGFNWSKVFAKASVGAVIGALTVFVLGFVKRKTRH